MVKPEWGSKRLCQGCGASFYDMRNNPIVCPKCGAQFKPVAVSKSSRSRAAQDTGAAATKPEIPAATKDVVADGDGDEIKVDDEGNLVGDDVIDTDDDDSDDDNIIEDPSELGEDEDDMFEVIESVKVKDEP